MKKSTSLIIGAALAAIAVCFVVYAAGHPEASFPWSNRITFMLYGAYIWLLLKFVERCLIIVKIYHKNFIAKIK